MPKLQRKTFIIDALWLGVLILYILAGTPLTPFHGDESTTIWMSRDYGYVFDNLDRLRYHQPPLDAAEQQLRLATGSLIKYLIGFSAAVNSYWIENINEQWDWGADWQYNQQTGHAPDDTLLMLGRWPAALMLATGAVVIFALGWLVDGRLVAYLASLFYALNPALLLNGRRAMFEGGLILFILLTLLMGGLFLRQRGWGRAILLAIVCGLAVSAKHPAVFTVIIVFAVCGFEAIRQKAFPDLLKLFVAGVLSLLIFYTLHPVLWGNNPAARINNVIDARSTILNGQIAAFSDYDDGLQDQIAGFWRQVFVIEPQYYEVPGWQDYIGDQIARYEASLWDGISPGRVGGVILLILTIVGLFALMQQRLVIMWMVGMFAVTLLTPLEWQRYYLMAHLAMALAVASGVGYLYRRTSSALEILP